MLQLANLPDSTTLVSLPGLKPPQFPKFPTFSELAGASVNDLPVVQKEKGLFEGMLGGNTEALFQDLVSCPHKYPPGADILLQEMIMGAKTIDSLDPDELLLLDQATLAFTQPSRAPVEEPIVPVQRSEDPADYLPELRDELDDDEPTAHVDVPKYWWRQ